MLRKAKEPFLQRKMDPLTAEEARSLDLHGTQLVVLSACDTGQGELSVGQGVYGLRRAFLVAGAETLVTSLWQVSDAATGKPMTLYYQKLLKEKKGGFAAMQEAMKQMRTQYKHPYYWAPFLVIGSDGPLRWPGKSFASSRRAARALRRTIERRQGSGRDSVPILRSPFG